MGAWGTDSCSSDDCWDLLQAEDIFNMTAAEVSTSVESAMRDERARKDARLGVVIWCLTHGWPVERAHAEKALKFARELLTDKDYLGEWSSPRERKASLLKEIAELEAFLPSGSPVARHVPGLLEQIDKHLSGEADS